MKKISEYEVVNHGIESADHFQGAGTAGYDEVFTGVGNSEKEALEDALEQAAEYWEIDERLEQEVASADADTEELDDLQREAARQELTELLEALMSQGKGRYLHYTLENAQIDEQDVEDYIRDVEGMVHHIVSVRLKGLEDSV